MRILASIFLLFSFCWNAVSQNGTVSQLSAIGSDLLKEQVSDEDKTKQAARFLDGLESYITDLGTDSVTTANFPFLSALSSDDKQTHIYTWALKRTDGSFHCYGLVSTKDKKTGDLKLFRLEDKSETLKNTETKNLGKASWLGCVYYSIVDISKGKKKMFLVLGYGGHTAQVRRKVADIISFSNVGEVQFGAPVFQTQKRMYNRVVLEYNAKASVSLKYFPEAEMIVYDYLAPVSELYIGNPAFYGPVGSYDGFKLKGGKFIQIKDVDARNPTENLGNRSKKVEKKIPPANR